jgi:hypothetical protein
MKQRLLDSADICRRVSCERHTVEVQNSPAKPNTTYCWPVRTARYRGWQGGLGRQRLIVHKCCFDPCLGRELNSHFREGSARIFDKSFSLRYITFPKVEMPRLVAYDT